MEDTKQLLDKMQAVKQQYKGSEVTKARGVYTAAIVGAGLGFIYAFSKQYNLLTGAIVGAGVAAIAAHLILPSKEDFEDD